MKINIDEIEVFLKIIIEKAKMNGFTKIEINNDFYWWLPTEESFDFNNSNPQLVVGSLYDDYNSLKKMIVDNVSTPLDLERLAHLMLALTYEISSSDNPFIC